MTQKSNADLPLARRYGPRAVIAGASEGIGAVLADRLAGAGLDLVLIARNEARLRAVAADVEARHGRDVRVLPLDLTDPGMHQAVAESCRDLEIGLLVYAAGSVNRTLDFTDDPYQASLRQVELNCVGPMGLARALGPAMLARGRGGIITVASMAALAGAAQIAVYSAVKAFQVNFGEGLWAEMSPRGVDVCTAVLGQTWTPALERQGIAYDPETDMLAEDVADEIIANIGNGPTYVVGARNQAIAGQVWPDRRMLVQMIGAHTSAHAARTSTAPS